MVSQVFHEGRLFWDIYRHDVSPPHSGYLLLSSKDVETRKMFRGVQHFFNKLACSCPRPRRLKYAINEGKFLDHEQSWKTTAPFVSCHEVADTRLRGLPL